MSYNYSQDSQSSRPLGIYIVTEPACLKPGSGAYHHIHTGLNELAKHSDIQALFCKIPPESQTSDPNCVRKTTVQLDRSHARGILRDVRRVLIQSAKALSFAKQVRASAPDYVYYRADFLDPLPLFLRLLGIPCFIEANGLQFERMRKFYRSPLESLNRCFEQLIYRSATHVFFVGSYGDYWKLNSKNWTNVENGIEREFLDYFPDQRLPSRDSLRLCFVGSLMQHHRADLLISAIKSFALKNPCELHLVGSNLAWIVEELEECVVIRNHGLLGRGELAGVLKNMDVGLIPGVTEFQSQMKLFDYGAARMAVVAPDTHNLKKWFADDLIFFRNNDPLSMVEALFEIFNDRARAAELGNQLHEKIQRQFTWDSIFERKMTIISDEISKK